MLVLHNFRPLAPLKLAEPSCCLKLNWVSSRRREQSAWGTCFRETALRNPSRKAVSFFSPSRRHGTAILRAAQARSGEVLTASRALGSDECPRRFAGDIAARRVAFGCTRARCRGGKRIA